MSTDANQGVDGVWEKKYYFKFCYNYTIKIILLSLLYSDVTIITIERQKLLIK